MASVSRKVKLKVPLYQSIYGVLILSLDVSSQQADMAEILGISRDELENLINQQMTEFLLLLGNTDEV